MSRNQEVNPYQAPSGGQTATPEAIAQPRVPVVYYVKTPLSPDKISLFLQDGEVEISQNELTPRMGYSGPMVGALIWIMVPIPDTSKREFEHYSARVLREEDDDSVIIKKDARIHPSKGGFVYYEI